MGNKPGRRGYEQAPQVEGSPPQERRAQAAGAAAMSRHHTTKNKSAVSTLRMQREAKERQLKYLTAEKEHATRHTCSVCSAGFLSSTTLDEHMVSRHGQLPSSSPRPPTTGRSPTSSSSRPSRDRPAPHSRRGAHNTNAAAAAERRLGKKPQKSLVMKERKNRTRDLLYGEKQTVLEDKPAVVHVCPACGERFLSSTSRLEHVQQAHGASAVDQLQEMDDEKAPHVDLSHEKDYQIIDILNEFEVVLQRNDEAAVAGTVKVLRKVLANLLKANTMEEQEKFGKIRLANPAMNRRFVQMNGGLKALESIGFQRVMLPSEQGMPEEVMVFDFSTAQLKYVEFGLRVIDEHFPKTP